MAKQGKSHAISEELRLEILRGKFDNTRKLPSDRMLMRRFGVARATVQAAMRDLFEKHLVSRRPGFGTFLAERAERAAGRTFGVIVPDAFYPFYTRICRGIDDAARAHGWRTITASLGSGDMRDRAEKTVEFAHVCVRERVGGVFFQPLQFLKDGVRFNRAVLDIFRKAGIPIVLLDSDYLPLPQRSAYDFVGIDNIASGYELARHMIGQGARRIWYFSNPLPAPTSVNRGNGVGLAVIEAGLRWTRANIFFADPTDTRAARRLFAGKNRPDAIIAVNDYIASILLKTLKAIGKRVPDDVLLAGFNGDPVCDESEPSLTTVVQPGAEIGNAAVMLMLRRMENPSMPACATFLSTQLKVRRSTVRK